MGGRKFFKKLKAELLRLTGVSYHIMTAYHPGGNGLVEQQNFITAQTLKAYINKQDGWYDCLDSIACALEVHIIIPQT